MSTLVVLVTYYIISGNKNSDNIEIKISYEEKPDQDALTPEEYKMYIKYLEKQRSKSLNLKSASIGDTGTYAGGKIKGTWYSKITHTTGNGYRVDNSAYDSLHDIFYVVSYAGHLYKLDTANGTNWILLNHKIQLNPPDNSTPNPIFFGVNLEDSTFRLIRSIEDLGYMQYSDDEGKNWIQSTGVNVIRSGANNGFELNDDGERKLILLCRYSNIFTPYISNDYGENYTASATKFSLDTCDARMAKVHNTNEACIFEWNKSSKKITVYKYDNAINDFSVYKESESVVPGNYISFAAASYNDGIYHFYILMNDGQDNIYYSNDQGETWTLKSAGNKFEAMHPKKPNILFSGFVDIRMSQDYGATWTEFDHKLGWDLQHIKMYEKSDGSLIAMLGLDFGCYISETPEDKESYTWVNNRAWYAMHYDAVTSENFYSIYMGNQDRGTTAYLDSGNNVNTIDIDGTDVLRVAYANHETSVWSWFYYGRIKHRYNFPTGKSGEAVYDGLGNWWAAPIIASPNPSEDAIYAAYGSNLQIFTFNNKTGQLTKSAHPFNFKKEFGSELGGFGYSVLNRNLWYASLNSGIFLYSSDAGITWTKTNYTSSRPRANDQTYNYKKNQQVIKASGIDTMKVYYAGVGNVFLISNDGGKTFTNYNNGLDVYRIRDFDLSPDEKFIFAACGYEGAWVFSVDDNQWYAMDDAPLPYVDYSDVQYINKKNIVRFATYGSGILDFKLDIPENPINSPENLILNVVSGKQIDLNWSDNSDNETGFILERAADGDFIVIDTLAENLSSYIDSSITFNKTYYYRIKAYNDNGVSHNSNLAFGTTPEKGLIMKTNWQIIYFDSEELDGEYAPVKYAFDNNPSSFWHTQWYGAQPNYPHEIQIDMGSSSDVAGLRYLPRQDGNPNGSIANYEFYVSNDTLNWGDPVITGTFASGSAMKEVIFDEKANGRYFRFVAKSEINGLRYASAAEIELLYMPVEPLSPDGLSATAVSHNLIKLTWNDNSVNETGFYIEQFNGTEFIIIDTVNANIKMYTSSDLLPEIEYIYRIRAFNLIGLSEYSNEASAITKEDVTGINHTKEISWKIYPNPVQEYLNIEFPANYEFHTLHIKDFNGRTIKSFKIENKDVLNKIDLKDLPNGIYLIEIVGNKKSLTKKIIKNN